MSRHPLRLGGDAWPTLRPVLAGLTLLLAACSKHEPPPATPAAPAKNAGGGLPRHDDGQQPPRPQEQPSVASPGGLPSEALAKEGTTIFDSTCATCHMADGGGVPNMQPSIIGSAWISNPDPQPLLSLILRGSAILGEAAQAYSNDMAPQEHLTDAEIAAVASHVRARFATPSITDPVTPAQVAIARRRPGLP